MNESNAGRSVRVLLVEPATGASPSLGRQLGTDGQGTIAVQSASDVESARAALSASHFDCVVCLHDPPRIDGVDALARLRESYPDLPVLLATETTNADSALSGEATDVVQVTDGEVHGGIVANRIESIVTRARERGKYEQIFDQANDGIIVHDPETGAILEANRRLYEMLGYDPDATDDLTLADVVEGGEEYTVETARDLIREARDEGTKTFEWLDATADGGERWVEVSLKPATLGGRDRVLSFVRDITESKQSEEVLRAREQELAAVFDHPASFAVVLDSDGRVLRANQPALESVGATAADIEGTPLWETPWWEHDGADANRMRRAVERAAAGDADRLEVEIVTEGGRRVLDLQVEPVETETAGRHAAGSVAVGYDITERRERERDLRERQGALRRLHEITSNPDLDLDAQVDRLLAFGADQLGMDIAFLSRIDEEAGDFEIVSAQGDHELLQAGNTSDLAETYCRHALDPDADSPLGIENAAEELGDDPAFQKFGLGCYLGERIVVNGDLYGTLCFADGDPRQTSFSAEDRSLLDIMAQWLRQELEQREYREDLEETRDRLQRTFERIDDAFFALDEDWRVTYANDAGADVLRQAMGADYDADELVGRHLWEEIPEAVETMFYEQYHRALETQESVTFEDYYEPLDVWFEVRAYPDEDGLSVYFTDVTERKEYERTLNDLLSATRAFIRASDEGELVEAILDGANAVFDYEISSVRLHDAEAGTLPPTRISTAAADHVPDPPVYDDDEGLVGEAFQSGTAVVIDDLADVSDFDYGPVDSAMFLPLDDHGVLGIGAVEPHAFDEEDVALVELLAVAAASAFDRLEREAEMRHLQRIVEHVDEKGFLLDGDGRFTFATDPLARYLGRDRDDLVGAELTAVVGPDDVDACEDVLARLRKHPDGERSFEATVPVGSGETRPVEIALAPTDGGSDSPEFAGVITDISELAETRTHLQSERERFRELFRNLPDPVVEVEFDGEAPIVEYANPAFADVFGYDADAVRGRDLNDLVVPEDAPDAGVALYSSAREEEQTRIDVQRETAQGRRDFLLRGIPYSRDDGTYAFAVYTDITDQKERERYLDVLNRVLRHNLRNDMNVVLLLARRLAEEIDDETLAEHARTLQRSAEDVAALSEKAKEIQRVLGRRGGETGTVEVASLLREVLTEQRENYPGAELSLDAPDELWIEGDDDIRRACEELVENALTHSDTESPRLDVEAGVVSGGDWVELRFRDDGPGIPDDEWRIVSGEEDISQLTHGSGLGLWLTRWIVESFGGELYREANDGGGTTIVVRLQRASPGSAAESRGRDRSETA